MDWREAIPPEDWAVYEAAGYGRRSGAGSRAALLVVDVTYGFVGHEPQPVLEAVVDYPNACGEAAWAALPCISTMLGAARDGGAPVFYTAGISDHVVDHSGRWREKHPRSLDEPGDARTILPEVAPRPGEILLEKTKPSAFYGTPLVALLVDQRVDTVVVTGCTTSGCVRATVGDAFSNGFHVVVVEDAVFDRSLFAHNANLFDMDQKYADVMTAADAAELACLAASGR